MVDVVLAQEPVEQVGELVEPVDPLLERAALAEDPAVEVATRADPEEEAAAARVVERDGVAGQDVGVAVVRRGDEDPEPDASR